VQALCPDEPFPALFKNHFLFPNVLMKWPGYLSAKKKPKNAVSAVLLLHAKKKINYFDQLLAMQLFDRECHFFTA
jgi:hypothetical protein